MKNFRAIKSIGLLIIVGIFLLAARNSLAQEVPVLEWAKNFGGSSVEGATSVKADASGNVYVVGYFSSSLVDFDPGPGTVNLSLVGTQDGFVSKFDPNGNLLWARSLGGSSGDIINDIEIDNAGNVYTTGYFANTVDFDPGVGTFNLTSSAGSYDAFILKLSSNGDFVWAGSVGGSLPDYGNAIDLDNSGNVFITGYFFSAPADFDPGAGIVNLSSTGDTDVFVLKLDNNGSYQWARQFGGVEDEKGHTLAIDGLGNVVITGQFYGYTASFDFDPGPATVTLTQVGSLLSEWDIYICKLDNATGNITWAKSISAPRWDEDEAMTIDNLDNILITGHFFGTADFDPDAGIFPLTTSGNTDPFIVKLNSSGNFIWAKSMRGFSTSNNYGHNITTDASGNVYTCGSFEFAMDADPGAAVFNLSAGGSRDAYVSKLDVNGNFVWAYKISSGSFDRGHSIALDPLGKVYTAGYFTGTADFDPGACTSNLTSNGSSDAFLQKITAGAVHTISSFSPGSGSVGATVTISGTNFSTIPSNNTVAFNGITSLVSASTTTSITTTVPSGATTGKISVVVNCVTASSASDFSVTTAPAVTPGVEWFNGIIGAPDIFIRSMTTDVLGHVYTAGQFGGTVDFDPNSGVFNLTSAGNGDIFVSKLTSDGNLVWAFRLGDAGNNDARQIAVDAVGDIYLLAGSFSSKYDTNGNLIRALPSFNASDIGTDAANNLYMTGSFTGTVDFDPGASVFNLTSAGSSDIFVMKLSSIGNFIWAKRIGGTQSENPQSIALDALGNPCIAGRFGLTVDFDPGAGTANLTAAGTTDIFVLKLDNAGNYVWARRLGSTNSEGADDIAIDAASNVLITGTFSGTLDFDPGASVANNTSVGGLDAFVLKINSAGNYVWAKTVGGSGQESGNSITTDGIGDVYYTGDYEFTVDFDPGPGVFNITTSSPNQIFVSKLDASGNFLWAIGTQPGSTSYDFSPEISLLPSDKIIVTGSFEDGTIDFDPGTCTSELIPPLISVSTFLLKLSLTAICSPTITSFTPTSGPIGTTLTITGTNFSATPANNTVQFNGTAAVVTASTTTSITTTVPAGATTGAITVTVAGNTATSATNFTVTASPIITITTQPFDFIACLGQTATFTTAAAGATNIIYQWQFSPDGIVPYTDIANGGGYSNATTATLSVNTTSNFGLGRYRCRINGDFAAEVITNDEGLFINPISAAPTVVGANRCGAGSVTLTASGGTNGQYKWYTTPSGGTAIAGETNSSYVTPSITSTTSYYVSLNTNGCESTRTLVTATLTITPAPTAAGVSGCPASAVTLTASGGTNGQYNWYTVATGGTAIAGATNNTYQIPSLIATSTFFVSITISGCESTRTPVTATLLSTGCAPVITTQTLTTQVEGKIEINLQSLITTPGTLDPTSIKVITQPVSGAVASITNFLLIIDYKGKPFSGKETIIIEACNTNGLCAQQTFTIEVAGEVIVFNAVSPNGDGKNEFLMLQFIESISPKNQVSIYNRWGDEVFSISDYDNKTRVFAGRTSGGNKLPAGSYFYKISLSDAGKTFTGFLDVKY